MPYGGDPVKILGPDILKGCAAALVGGVLALIICGLLVGLAL